MSKGNSRSVSGKSNPAAFALEFIGSLIYLALLYLTSTGVIAVGAFSTALTSTWLPLLYAAGALSAILLFIVSFLNLARHNPFARAAACPAFVGGFSYVAMTAGNPTYVGLALIGFIIAIFGAGYGFAGYKKE